MLVAAGGRAGRRASWPDEGTDGREAPRHASVAWACRAPDVARSDRSLRRAGPCRRPPRPSRPRRARRTRRGGRRRPAPRRRRPRAFSAPPNAARALAEVLDVGVAAGRGASGPGAGARPCARGRGARRAEAAPRRRARAGAVPAISGLACPERGRASAAGGRAGRPSAAGRRARRSPRAPDEQAEGGGGARRLRRRSARVHVRHLGRRGRRPPGPRRRAPASIVSRSRTVTVPSSRVWLSMVTQYGVPDLVLPAVALARRCRPRRRRQRKSLAEALVDLARRSGIPSF